MAHRPGRVPKSDTWRVNIAADTVTSDNEMSQLARATKHCPVSVHLIHAFESICNAPHTVRSHVVPESSAPCKVHVRHSSVRRQAHLRSVVATGHQSAGESHAHRPHASPRCEPLGVSWSATSLAIHHPHRFIMPHSWLRLTRSPNANERDGFPIDSGSVGVRNWVSRRLMAQTPLSGHLVDHNTLPSALLCLRRATSLGEF